MEPELLPPGSGAGTHHGAEAEPAWVGRDEGLRKERKSRSAPACVGGKIGDLLDRAVSIEGHGSRLDNGDTVGLARWVLVISIRHDPTS